MKKETIAEEIYQLLVLKLGKRIAHFFDKGFQGLFLILRYISSKEEDGASPGEIASSLSFTTPRVAVALRNLENKNLIHREQEKEDRRKYRVYITEKGKKALEQREEECLHKLERHLQCLSQGEQMQLMKILGKMWTMDA